MKTDLNLSYSTSNYNPLDLERKFPLSCKFGLLQHLTCEICNHTMN